MYPYLIQTTSITLGSYGVMLAIAYLVGRSIFIKNLHSVTSPKNNFESLIIALLVFAVIGAKLMFMVKNPNIAPINSLTSYFQPSGFSSQGALSAAILVMLVYSQISKISLDKLLDAAAEPAIIGYALARLGCFLSGDDCWGLPSSLPWAMAFPDGIAKTPPGVTVHPVPLYEIVYSIVIFGLLKSGYFYKQPYQAFFFLLFSWGLGRFIVEFWSSNPKIWLEMSGSQLGALLMLAVGASALFYTGFFRQKKAG